jgi:hypothetical protein
MSFNFNSLRLIAANIYPFIERIRFEKNDKSRNVKKKKEFFLSIKLKLNNEHYKSEDKINNFTLI